MMQRYVKDGLKFCCVECDRCHATAKAYPDNGMGELLSRGWARGKKWEVDHATNAGKCEACAGIGKQLGFAMGGR